MTLPSPIWGVTSSEQVTNSEGTTNYTESIHMTSNLFLFCILRRNNSEVTTGVEESAARVSGRSAWRKAVGVHWWDRQAGKGSWAERASARLWRVRRWLLVLRMLLQGSEAWGESERAQTKG